MHFEHCGAGDAILFIHGMPTSDRLWRGITDRLHERYTCFTIDLPGLGKSPQEQYGPDYLHRLAERIDELPNAKQIILDSGHFVPMQQPEAVATSLARFFASRSGQAGMLSTVQA